MSDAATDHGIDPCPSCETTDGVQLITGTSPKVQAWSCASCGTQWAITVVNPRPKPYLDQLARVVELQATRTILREVITLADRASMISNAELRSRLLTLANRATNGPTR